MRTAYIPLLLLAFFAFPSFTFAEDDSSSATKKQATTETKEEKDKKKKPLITVSKETTRVLGPVDEEGYVDYLEALNQHCARGVTPQNNAAVLFWQALGPERIESEALRKPFFKKLGIESPAVEGKYFVTLKEHLRDKDRIEIDLWEERLSDVNDKPWSKMDYPVLADWLKANEKPLDTIVAGTRRTAYYNPLVVEEGTSPAIVAANLMGIQHYREAARALCARAMLRLKEGKIEAAWADAMACQRMGRLIGRSPTLVEALVGIAVSGVAESSQTALAHSGKLTAAQAAKFHADLNKLGPGAAITEKIDVGERMMYIDAVTATAQQGAGTIADLSGGGEKKKGLSAAIEKALSNSLIDWNEPLRIGNHWYDRIIEAGQKPTYRQRQEASAKVFDDLEAYASKVSDPKWRALTLLFGGRKARGKALGRIFVSLMMPAIGAAHAAEQQGNTRWRLTQLAFSLEGYRIDNGKYPDRLELLKPKYIHEIPIDAFSEKSLRYQQNKSGYQLWSVGKNGQDDDGVGYGDEHRGFGDDIVIRTPGWKKP